LHFCDVAHRILDGAEKGDRYTVVSVCDHYVLIEHERNARVTLQARHCCSC
jgi:hypothetical protein